MALSIFCSSVLVPTIYSRSSARGTKEPLGMMHSSPRWTAQISTLALRSPWDSPRLRPTRKSSGCACRPIMSMRPPANGSTEMAAGKLRIRAISCAAARSGLMTISSPISRLRMSASRRYSVLRTRAMVWRAPRLFAIRQQTILVSSTPVTAMTRSAERTPASISTLMDAPLPWIHMTSSVLSALVRWAISLSTITMSCFSCSIWRAMAYPTLPQPTIMIFMLPPPRPTGARRFSFAGPELPTAPRPKSAPARTYTATAAPPRWWR